MLFSEALTAMTPSGMLAQVEEAIRDLERKHHALTGLLEQYRIFRDQLKAVPPELLQLLNDPAAVNASSSGTNAPPAPAVVRQDGTIVDHTGAEDSDWSQADDREATEEESGPVEEGVGDGRKRDLEGKTIVEAARTILSEAGGGPRHYIAIAREASLRGYRGRSDDPDTLHQSFWAMMNRTTDVFEKSGQGRYKLRPPNREG
jgi:hypothetical protein